MPMAESVPVAVNSVWQRETVERTLPSMEATRPSLLTSAASSRLDAIRDTARAAPLLHAYPLETVVATIRGIAEPSSYGYLPESIFAALSALNNRFGPAETGFYKKQLIIQLIDEMPARIQALSLPKSIEELYPDILDVVVETLVDTPDQQYLATVGDLIRELRITSARSIPCGAQIVDNCTSAPRSIYRYQGLRNNLKSLWFILSRLGGLSPLFRIHTESRYLKYFNETGWDDCYRRISELMRGNPRIRGLIATSWFYDPQLEIISPRLAYLRRRPVDNGAYLHFDGTNDIDIERATSTSPTRRELYEKGEYMPTCYTLLWARADLLRWAARN